MKLNLLTKWWPKLGQRSTPFSADVGAGFLNWGDILSGSSGGGIRSTKLTSPTSQHPYASGAIRLAGTMLGSVPWVIVQEDTAARTRLQEALERGCAVELQKVRDFERLAKPHRPMSCTRMHQGAPTKPAPDGNAWQTLFEEGTVGVSRSELFSATLQQALGAGSGKVYWLLRGGVDGMLEENEMPREISVWPSANVKREKDGTFKFDTAGGKKTYPAHQVIEYRFYSAATGGAGSPLQAAWKNMQSDLAAQEWNAEFFENGAQVGNVLSTDQKLTPDQAEAMGRSWEEKHRSNGKTAVLGQGVQLTATTATHSEMAFAEGFKVNRDAVLATLLVHKAAMGVTDDLNRATIDAARKMMWSNLLIPFGAYVEDVAYANLFSRFDNGRMWGVFDISGVPELADDVQTKAEALSTLTTAGIPMNDAVRVTGLDLPLYGWGEDPMGHLGGLEPDPAGADPEPPRAAKVDKESQRVDKQSEIHARHTRAQSKADAWWHSVGSMIEKKYQASVRKVFLAIRKEVLANLDAQRSETRTVDEAEIMALLFDVNRFTEALREGTNDLYQRTFDSAFEGIIGELTDAGYSEAKIKFNLTDAAVIRWIETKDLRLRNVIKNVRDELQKAITAQVKQNATVAQIAKEIRRVSNYQLDPARTLMIARTETGSASNNVRWLGMGAAGVGHVSWVAASDAREEHKAINDLTLQAAVDGTPFEMGTNFAAEIGIGGVLRFPHDPQGEAGMVINCRCVMVPEVPASEDLLLGGTPSGSGEPPAPPAGIAIMDFA